MSDKDFDKLFRQKFDEFEVEASKDVWAGISNTLDQNRKGKSDSRFVLTAAASIVLVAATALWFAPRSEKVWLQKEQAASAVVPEQSKITPASPNVQDKTVLKHPRGVKNNDFNYKVALISSPKAVVPKVAPVDKHRLEKTHNSLEEIEDKKLASVLPAFENVTQPVEVKALAVLHEEAPLSESPESKAGIKSIGTLVNFVVGKVDKRKDKIIEFKDTDEGTLLSGINLGFVKIKTHN